MTKEKNPEETTGFRVVDKRRFDDSGTARENVDPSRSDPSSAGTHSIGSTHSTDTKPTTNPTSDKTRTTTTANTTTSQTTTKNHPPQQQHQPQEHPPQVDFSALVMSLATQVVMLLGEGADPTQPGNENHSKNLPAAQQTIDLLGMLAEKTKGNLTSDEEKLLTEVLSQLRLAFVKSL